MELDAQQVYLKVTAAKDFAVRGQPWVKDMYNSEAYFIRAGHAITIPPDAARHIFGCIYKQSSMEDMFKHFTKRQGWNTPEMAPLAKELWKKLKFEAVVMTMVETPVSELAKDEAA